MKSAKKSILKKEKRNPQYVQIAEEEDQDAVELPAEEDGTLLQSTLQAQFPGSTGLKFRNAETDAIRGIRLSEGRYYPPNSENGWDGNVYFCVYPKETKRKIEDDDSKPLSKTKRFEAQCIDLIVLNLLFSTTEESLRKYFEDFGEVVMAQTKKHRDSGLSKGFGFVRFADVKVQNRVLSTRHLIDGRWCEVKVPNSNQGMVKQEPCKIFVGRITEDITEKDLREYFSKFGEVTDVFIPRPFRSFSFVSFLDSDVAQSLFGEYHVVKGVSVFVANADPKTDKKQSNKNGNQNQGNGNQSFDSQQSDGNLNPAKLMQLLQQACNSPQNNFGGNSNMQGQSQAIPPWQNGGWNNQNQGGFNMSNQQPMGYNQSSQNNMNPLTMNPGALAAALSQLSAFSNMQNQPKNQQNQPKIFDPYSGGQSRQNNRPFGGENSNSNSNSSSLKQQHF